MFPFGCGFRESGGLNDEAHYQLFYFFLWEVHVSLNLTKPTKQILSSASPSKSHMDVLFYHYPRFLDHKVYDLGITGYFTTHKTSDFCPFSNFSLVFLAIGIPKWHMVEKNVEY